MSTASANPPSDWRKEVLDGLEEMKQFSRRGFFTLIGLITFSVAT